MATVHPITRLRVSARDDGRAVPLDEDWPCRWMRPEAHLTLMRPPTRGPGRVEEGTSGNKSIGKSATFESAQERGDKIDCFAGQE